MSSTKGCLCGGVTQKGTRCKKACLPGLLVCRLHRNQQDRVEKESGPRDELVEKKKKKKGGEERETKHVSRRKGSVGDTKTNGHVTVQPIWAVGSDYQMVNSFLIHDNMGIPFRVEVDQMEKEITIWERDYIYNARSLPQETTIMIIGKTTTKNKMITKEREPYEKEVTNERDARKMARRMGHKILEEDDYKLGGWVTEGRYGSWRYHNYWMGIEQDQPGFLGNTFVFQVQTQKTKPREGSRYIFVQRDVFEIHLAPGDEPCALLSPIGANDVPYPLLVGKSHTYLLLSDVYTSNSNVTVHEMFPRRDSGYDLYERYWKDEENRMWLKMKPSLRVDKQ